MTVNPSGRTLRCGTNQTFTATVANTSEKTVSWQVNSQPVGNSARTWVPSTSMDQYAGAVAKWFGLAQADLDYVFPDLHSFGYQTLGIV